MDFLTSELLYEVRVFTSEDTSLISGIMGMVTLMANLVWLQSLSLISFLKAIKLIYLNTRKVIFGHSEFLFG